LLWESGEEKHESVIRAMYDIVVEIASVHPPKPILDFLF